MKKITTVSLRATLALITRSAPGGQQAGVELAAGWLRGGAIAVAIALLGAAQATATVLTFYVDSQVSSAILNQNYGDRVTATSDAVGTYGPAGGFTPNVVVSYAAQAGGNYAANELQYIMTSEWSGSGIICNGDGNENWSVSFTADPGYKVTLHGLHLSRFAYYGTGILPGISIINENNQVLYSAANVDVNSALNLPFALDFGAGYSGSTLTIRMDMGTNTATGAIAFDDITFSQTAVPLIGTQPQNQTVPKGASAIFSVAASSPVNAPLTYQWRRNGANIAGATAATVALPPAAVVESGGEITVIVTAGAEATTSSAAVLTVIDPAVITWTGALSSDPYTAGNWDLNRVPTASDTVRLNGGTLNAVFGAFVIVSGGTTTLRGAIRSQVTVAPGASVVLETEGYHDLTGSLVNAGTVIWKSGTLYGSKLESSAPSLIINQPGGILDLQADGSIAQNNGAGSLLIMNGGTLRRTVGTGVVNVEAPVINAGAVEGVSGTLHFNDSLTLASGSLTATPPGAIQVNGGCNGVYQGAGVVFANMVGSLTLAADSSAILTGSITGQLTVVAGATLNIETENQHNLTGSLVNAGTVAWKAGTLYGSKVAPTLVPSTIVNQAGGVFELQPDNTIVENSGAGSLTITNAGTLRRTTGTGTLNIEAPVTNSGAVQCLSGTLRFSDSVELATGAMTGTAPGTILFAGGLTGVLRGTGVVLTHLYGDCTLAANTVLRLDGGISGQMTVSAGATLNIETESQHDLTGSLVNAGTVVWKAGTLYGTKVDPHLTPSTIENQAGGVFELQPNNTIVENNGAGSLTIANAGTLRRTTGTETLNIEAPVTNSGTVQCATGTLRFSDSVDFSTGTFTGTSPGTILFAGPVNGVLRGTGLALANLNGTCTLAAGTVAVLHGGITGQTTVAAGATLLIETDSQHNIVGSLINAGTVIWKAGTIYGSKIEPNLAPSTIENQAGGRFEMWPDNSIVQNNGDGSYTFSNSGIVVRSTGTGAVNIYGPFTNTGLVQVLTGTLNFGGGFTNNGAVSGAAGAQLIAGGSPLPLAPVITTHPQSQTVVEGANVTLSVVASGTPLPTYQWKKDGTDISGATGASLVLTSVQTTAAGSYTVVVSNGVGSPATSNAAVLTLNVTGPANDHFANAETLTGTSATATSNTSTATLESGEPTQSAVAAPSVWWKWTAPAHLTTTVDTRDSAYDTVLAVYTGTALNNLAVVAWNDDENPPHLPTTSRTTFSAVSGTTYFFQVNGWVPASKGAVKFNLATVPGPANDYFAAAASLTGSTVAVTADNTWATREPSEPTHYHSASSVGVHSLWWKWVAPAAGRVALDTIGSAFDTLLVVYTGSAVNALTLVTGDNDTGGSFTSALTFNAVSGTTYYFKVDGFEPHRFGALNLNLALTASQAPQITTHPQSQVVTVGGSAAFAVVATGAPAPTYQWMKGPLALANGTQTSGSVIAGATSATLTFTNLQSGDAGTYDLIVSNGISPNATSVFTLTVNAAASPFAVNFDNFTANATLNGQDTPAWVAYQLSTYVDPLVVPGDAGHATNYVQGPVGWHPSAARVALAAPLVYAAGSGMADWRVQLSVPQPSSSAGNTSALFSLSDAVGVGFGVRGFAAANNPPAGFPGDTAVLCLDDGLGGLHVGSAITPNAWYEVKLLVNFTAASPTGSLYYRNLTAAQSAFTADPLLQDIDLKLAATNGQYTFVNASIWPFNGGKIDALAASLPSTAALPVISSATSAAATVGTPFTFTVTATNSPTVFGLTGTLPAGLSFAPATGVISGTPTAAGAFPVTVTATNATGTSPGATLTLTVNAAAAPFAVNFDNYTANATLNGQGTPAWVAVTNSNYIDPRVLPGDAGHATNYVQGPVDWRSSGASLTLATPLVYAAGSGLAEWGLQFSVPQPSSSHGNTSSVLGFVSNSRLVRFGANGIATVNNPPAGFPGDTAVFWLEDGLGVSHVGATITPNAWYEVKLVVNFTAASPTGSLFYRNLTAGQSAFTADSLLQNVDLKLTAASGLYSIGSAYHWVSNGGKLDALSASLAVPPATGEATFDTGIDGWTVVSFTNLATNTYSLSGTYSATYVATGGNPGGHIQSSDPDGGDFTFSAPTTFLGNRAAAAGGTLSYDLIHPTGGVDLQAADVILVGNGQRLVWQASPTLAPSSTWLPVSVPLSPTPQWHVDTTTGAVPTTTDFQAVLGNLTGLYIRGEYYFGSETSGLDNVRFASTAVAPVISVQPQSQVVANGATVTLTVAATGTAPLSYQWLKAGTPLFNGTAASLATVSGVQTATLTLTGVQTGDAGLYSVQVRNSVGTVTSSPAALTVGSAGVAPMLYGTTPRSQTAVVGQDVTFAVSTAGSPTLTYLWKKDGTPIADATGTSLMLSSVQLATAGTYTVTVSNTFGSWNSGDLKLTVAAAAPVNDNFASATVITGASASVTGTNVGASAETGEPDHSGHLEGGQTHGGYSVWWQWTAPQTGAYSLQLVPITGTTFEPLLGVYSGSSVGALTRLWSGFGSSVGFFATAGVNYHFAVDGSFGGTGAFTLGLATATGMAPAIFHPLMAQGVLPGQTISLFVMVSGTQPMTYVWKKGTAVLADGGRVSGATTQTLLIADAQSSDAGDYSVVVTNNIGSATSNSATVAVSDPVIGYSPQSQTANVGDTVYFTGYAQGTAPLTYRWQKGGTNLSDSGTINGASTASLTLTGVQLADAGNYAVVVTNGTGATATSTPAALTVNSSSTLPSITSASSVAATVGTAFNFQVTASNSPTSFGATTLPPGLTFNTSNGLFDGTPTTAGTYVVTLTASNTAGTGPTAALTITVSSPPQIVLSGMTLWDSTANGTWTHDFYHNTLGSETDSNSVSNVYLFTGSTTAPVFINGGNSDASLNLNRGLTPGTYVYQFAGNNSTETDTYVGINLFFNGDLANNRISAFVPKDGTTNFSVIPASTTTFGETGSTGAGVAGSGSLSFTSNGVTVTLTSLSVMTRATSPDLVTAYSTGTTPGSGDFNHTADTVGTLTLTVTAASTGPANDSFASAQVLAGNSGTVNGTNVGATGETGEPLHVNSSGTASSVWYRWTPAQSGSATVSTDNSAIDTVMAIYTGSALASLTQLAQDDDSGSTNHASKVTIPVTAGITYYIAVGGFGASVSGSIALNWAVAFAPANDNFANRVALTGLPVSTTGSNVSASRESNEPTSHGSSGGSVWWTWTAPSSGSVTIDTNGSAFDTILAVYTGTTMGGLSVIAYDDDNGDGSASLVTFSATAGTAYQIAVGGYGGSNGSITLHITGGGSSTIPVITSTNMATGTVGSAFTYTITATNSPTSFTATPLPVGLTLNPVTGVISGTPTTVAGTSVTVTASNGSGPSADFTLTIAVSAPVAPSIAAPPLAQAVAPGTTATFMVVADGTAPLRYQWQKNGVAIDGATAATLGLVSVQTTANGAYSVVVTNDVSSVTSQAALLYVGAPVGVRSAAAGSDHTLFVTLDGTLWGLGNNLSGQLGLGGSMARATPVPVAFGVEKVVVGIWHSLFLKTDGTLWSMGHNPNGAIGDGTVVARSVPYQLASGVTTMAAGYFHSVFVKAGGTLWGVGDNSAGQLGDGTTTDRLTPVQITGVTDVVAVSAGNWHTMFLKANGSLWGIGANDSGQLCDGTTTARTSPVQVATGIAAVSAGWFETHFLKTDGTLMAVGNNEYGQLGDGTLINRPAAVQIATGVTGVSSRFSHSAFVKSNGTLWTTGFNDHSQLGDGTLVNRPAPASFTTDVASVFIGDRFTLWLKTNGSLWGVGSNDRSQLGQPAAEVQASPVLIAAAAVVGSPPVVAITSPANGATFALGVPINLTAVATDTDGTIANVRFYANDVLLGTVNTAPYTQAWTPTATGPIIAYAIATDNSGNQTTSVVVNLAVNSASGAPVTTHPQAQTVAIGGTATFSITATGTAPLTYQWKLGPSNVIDGGSIFGATSPTLVITGVQPADSGIYTCVVTGGSGSGSTTSNGALLTVTSGGIAPYLTSSMRHQTALVGGTVNFAVTVGGTPPFTYQWKKDNNAIGSATNATLTLTNVQTTAAGSYTVQITGTTVITSPAMALTVTATAPTNDLFANATTLSGASASAPGANLGASLELREPDHIGHTEPGPSHGGASVWWKWTAPATGAVAVNTLGSSFQTLLAVYTGTSVSGLTRVGANDNGGANFTSALSFAATSGTTYYLAVDGLDGATGTIQLNLAPGTATAPSFVTHPIGIPAPAGGNVGLSARVAGTAPFTYLWKKDGVDVPGGTTNPLMLRNVTASAAGSYTLTVTNGVSSATSNAAVLTIVGEIGPLAIHYQPQSLTVPAGGNAVLDLWVTGTPPLTFQWRKNSVALANGTSAGGATLAGATSTTLSLTGVQAGDAGSYTCYVSNGLTNVTSEVATLTVSGTTGTPPTVALTSPAPSTSFAAGSAVSVMATATDTDGTVASVQFFANGTSLGTDTSAPYELSWTPTTAGSYALTAKAVDNTGLETTSTPVAVTVTAPVQLPAITSATTATATVGTAFTFQVTASNSPTTFAATGLPPGLNLSVSNGAIGGTPTTAGTYPVSLTAANAVGTGAASTLTITVSAAGTPPTASTLAKTADATNVDFLWNPGVTGKWAGFLFTTGSQPCTVSRIAARILGTTTTMPPFGMLFDASGGSFIPAAALAGFTTTDPVTSSLSTVNFTSASPVTLAASHTYYFVLTASGPNPEVPGTYQWARTAVSSGSDIEAGSGWVLPGSYVAKSFTPPPPDGSLTAWTTDTNYRLMAAVYASITGTAVPAITSAATATGTVGTAFTFQVTASNSPTSFAATGLPPGLNLSVSTGAISGTPTTAGTYPVSLTAANGGGTGTASTLTITVSAAALVPVIAVQPTSQAAIIGGTAAFSVTATNPSTGSLTYLWYFTPATNGTPQALADITGKLAGTHTASLTVSNAQTADAGDYVCVVTNGVGSTTSHAAQFMVATRIVRIVSQTAAPGAQVVVPIQLLSAGDENNVTFGLQFNPTKLTYVSHAAGADMAGGTVQANVTQKGNGQLGFLIGKASGAVHTAGTRMLVTITFTVAAGMAGDEVTYLTFADQPTARRIFAVNGDPLLGAFADGQVTAVIGLEGDINGDGEVDGGDWVKLGRMVVGLDPTPTSGVAFMRADIAPRTTKGDGTVDGGDWVQLGRYVVGLDTLQSAGGPSSPTP